MKNATTFAVLLASVASSLVQAGGVGSIRSNGHRGLQAPPLEVPDWVTDIVNGEAPEDVVADVVGDAAPEWALAILNGTVPLEDLAGVIPEWAVELFLNGTIPPELPIDVPEWALALLNGTAPTDAIPEWAMELLPDWALALLNGTAPEDVLAGVELPGWVLALLNGTVPTDFPAELPEWVLGFLTGAGQSQICQAVSNVTSCECSMDEEMCFKINCTSILPGAVIDTCQLLNTGNGTDIVNFLPVFRKVDPNFEQAADIIPWQRLNWDTIDFANFDVTDIAWTDDWASKTWNDLVGNWSGLTSPGVCQFMSMAVELTEQLGVEGSCACDGEDGMQISCNFTKVCADGEDSLCGDVEMKLNFDSLSAVDANVCIDFAKDIHPETCFTYKIPVAGQNIAPECSATYGDKGTCKCTIDEKLCISVDCSEFEPTAVTNTCQLVSLGGQVEATSLVMNFESPVVEQEDVVESTSSAQVPEGSSAPSFIHLNVAVGVIALLSGFLGLL